MDYFRVPLLISKYFDSPTLSRGKRMPTKKQASKKTDHQSGPTASRPHMPGYGITADKKGLLPWSHVAEHTV